MTRDAASFARMSALARVSLAGIPAGLADDVQRAAEHAAHARAVTTRRAYARAWERWASYARDHGAIELPASALAVAAYLAHLDAEGLAPASLDLALAALADRHGAAGLPSPSEEHAVRAVRAGIRARRGTRPRTKAALSPAALHEMIAALPPDVSGARDRALLLLGFASALRRSELVALHVVHVAWHVRGVVLLIARSKSDQEGAGVEVPIHAAPGSSLCPVAALRAWLDIAGIVSGPVFRGVDRWGRVSGHALTGGAVAGIVKRAAVRVGLEAGELAGHSLRAGFATTAAREGASLAEIGRITRHASEGMIRRYIRAGTLFERDPLRGVLAR